jgi:two-component system sensor histidine kinase QseC
MLLGLIGLFTISGTLLYLYMHTVLTRQFNASLAAKAQALCSLIKLKLNGEVELELTQQPISQLGVHAHFEYFQIWGEDGTVLVRSPALGMKDLPHAVAETPVFENIDLPEGRPGKAIVLSFMPVADDEDIGDGTKLQGQTTQVSGRSVTLAVAQDRGDLDRVMGILLSALLLVAAFIVIGTVVVVSFVVQQGLQPLQQVAWEAAHIDEQSLHVRFSLDGLPSELQPICRQLNDSLERLQKAFQRERRFAADVAHELRTPIAELRSLADVALKWQGDPETSLSYFQDAQNIAQQMEGIVTTLLALARCQSGMMTILCEAVDIGDVVKQAWQLCEQKAADRNLAATFDLSSPLFLETDHIILHSIVSNLLTNAVEYTTRDGAICCNAQCNSSGMKFSVTNDTDFLTHDDLPHLFEAFWRKDPARTDNLHCGLGLTLVDAYAKILGGNVTVSMPTRKSLCVTLDLPLTICKEIGA